MERAALEQRLRDIRTGLEAELSRQVAERQRLEQMLAGAVHPAERPSLERQLTELQQAEARARAKLATADARAQAEQRALETKQQQDLVALEAAETRMKAEIATLVTREQRLQELQKEAASVLDAAKEQIGASARQLTESVVRLDRAYQGIRGYNSNPPMAEGSQTSTGK